MPDKTKSTVPSPSEAGNVVTASPWDGQPEVRFVWIDEVLPAGPWPESLRARVSQAMWNVGFTVVRSGELGPLEMLYRDFVSIYPRLMVDASDADRAAQLYTIIHLMLWRRTQILSQLLTFNSDVVQPFVSYLDRCFPKCAPRQPARALPRIAYLSETRDLFGSNAVARVTVSLMLGQHELHAPEDRPILYCMNKTVTELWDFAAQHELEVRDLARDTPLQTVEAILEQLRVDNIGILVADSNCAIATMVMQRRPVPLQAFHENGFAPWSVTELDVAFLGITKPSHDLFANHVKMLSTPRNTAYIFQNIDRPREKIDAVHAYLRDASGIADPSVIYGFYGRTEKITAEYMTHIEAILLRDPKAIFFAGGTGVGVIVEACKSTSPVADRIIFYNAFVDGHIVSECIDVFLDTSPFPGGMSCIEVQARGVPVVWTTSADLPAIISDHRDPALMARDGNQFVELAAALGKSVARVARRPVALQIARDVGDMTGQAKEVETHLRTAWRDVCLGV